MRLLGTVAWILASLGASAGNLQPLTICLNPGSETALKKARFQAGAVLRKAGVDVSWKNSLEACVAGRGDIVVSVSYDTPDGLHRGALAYALPYERTHAVLFYDRVLVSTSRERLPLVLGYILAHEVAHLLQGIERHSASGVMKARWDSLDLGEMVCRGLSFTADDVDLIQAGLKRRIARAAAPYDGLNGNGAELRAAAADRDSLPLGR